MLAVLNAMLIWNLWNVLFLSFIGILTDITFEMYTLADVIVYNARITDKIKLLIPKIFKRNPNALYQILFLHLMLQKLMAFYGFPQFFLYKVKYQSCTICCLPCTKPTLSALIRKGVTAANLYSKILEYIFRSVFKREIKSFAD